MAEWKSLIKIEIINKKTINKLCIKNITKTLKYGNVSETDGTMF